VIPLGKNFFWEQFIPTTTITAATIVTIVNKANNQTRLETRYNTIPAGYSLPSTNSAGTVTCDIVMNRGSHNLTTSLYVPASVFQTPSTHAASAFSQHSLKIIKMYIPGGELYKQLLRQAAAVLA
jgi:hypothetical protein